MLALGLHDGMTAVVVMKIPEQTPPCTVVALMLIAALVLPIGLPGVACGARDERVKETIVKIHAVANPADLFSPWQGIGTESYAGTGVILEGNRILTNAHLIADQVSVEVRREGTTRLYEARVVHAGHASDLALLEVDDQEFFQGVEPLPLGEMVALQDTVEVYGFPIGGDSVSVTSGIVSRIEVGPYSHSDEELLLVQVDAALNPGNSGGPVVADGRMVGVALQALGGAENVGYMIPAPVVEHFLKDVADGTFDGFPTLGADLQRVANNALRASLRLRDDETGALVSRLNFGATAQGVLQPGDVLLAVDGLPIGEDLTVKLPEADVRLDVSWAIRRKQIGESIALDFARGEQRLHGEVTLRDAALLVPGPRYDVKPSYFVLGGLVFQPLTLDYLEVLSEWGHDLAYYGLHRYFRTADRHQVVLLSRVLAAPVNRGYHDWANLIVASINGTAPRDLAHAVALLEAAEGPRLEVRTEEDGVLVLDLKQARAGNAALLERYGIAHDRSADLRATAK